MKRRAVRSLDDLKLDPHNPNRGTERGAALLRRSVEDVGVGRSVVVSADGVVLAGNKTLEAARAAGVRHLVEVETDGDALVAVVRRDLKADDPRALRLKVLDNRTAEVGIAWDPEVLRLIQGAKANLLAGPTPAFTEQEWRRVALADQAEAEESERQDEAGAAEAERFGVRVGQTWEIPSKHGGAHLVTCGDALRVPGARCDGCVTDPPYDLEPKKAAEAIFRWADAAIVLCAQRLTWGLARATDVRLDMVWRHSTPRKLPNLSMPLVFHANVLVLTRDARVRTGWRKPRPDYGSIIEADSQYETRHGHGKSAALFVAMMEPVPWKTVWDPFLGSGATLVACERTRRLLRGVEIEPRWVALALQRAADAGLAPRLAGAKRKRS